MGMITGIGTDMVLISRIEKLHKKYGKRFLDRVLSREEIEHLPAQNPGNYIAGRFAVKECLVKALGDRAFSFNEVSVLNDEKGRPYIANPRVLFGTDQENSIILRIHVSISHEKDHALAFVVIEGCE
jgi:holo-[acyl-carrier protein] synthase